MLADIIYFQILVQQSCEYLFSLFTLPPNNRDGTFLDTQTEATDRLFTSNKVNIYVPSFIYYKFNVG